MTYYDYLGRGSHSAVTANVQNAFWLHGVEDHTGRGGRYGGTTRHYRDYDSDSPSWYNWPRMELTFAPGTQVVDRPTYANHGAIGGSPGYSPDEPIGYQYYYDMLMSTKVDIALRNNARSLGLPVSSMTRDDYGFPTSQGDLPRVR
jgi:hypothetical protein